MKRLFKEIVVRKPVLRPLMRRSFKEIVVSFTEAAPP
jgi:hypothetical protein